MTIRKEIIMKTKVRRILAAVMAATMAVGMASTGVSASAANVESEAVSTTAVEETVSPRYAYYASVSFTTTTGNPYKGPNGTPQSFTVTDAPAKVSYWSCTTGTALLTIYVNGSEYDTYVIPASSGATINNTISCSKGDKITYKVLPNASANCVKAVGSFTMYY